MSMGRDERRKELKLAIARVASGRSKESGRTLTISAVAREVGVSASLIHNCFPEIAEEIRARAGIPRTAIKQSESRIAELKKRNNELRQEVREVRRKLAAIATQNELLAMRVQQLESIEKSRVAFISKHPKAIPRA